MILTAHGLSKRYGKRCALSDCTLEVPAGRVVGLVGPNGAGKSTLLNLAVGLLAPTAGTIEVLGARPGAQLAKVGFVAHARCDHGRAPRPSRGSSHLVSDLERVCDHLIVLVASRVQIANDIDALMATHLRLTGPRRDALPPGVISASHTERQSTLLVRTAEPIYDPGWTVSELTLEDLVLAYMSASAEPRRTLEAVR